MGFINSSFSKNMDAYLFEVKIERCKNGCIAYIDEHTLRSFCPKCRSPRYKPCKCGVLNCACEDRVPVDTFSWFPIETRLVKIFNSYLLRFLWYPWKRFKPYTPGPNHWMYDIYDGETSKQFQWQCKNDDMLIALGCCSDGFLMFKHGTTSLLLLCLYVY